MIFRTRVRCLYSLWLEHFWPISLSTGVGMGMAYSDCNFEFSDYRRSFPKKSAAVVVVAENGTPAPTADEAHPKSG